MNETLLKQIGVWLIAGAFATLVGLASAILPWWLVVPVFLLPMLVAAGWRWPLMAFVFVLLAALGVLPVVKNKLVDLLLVAFLGLMIVVRLHDLPRIMARYRPEMRKLYYDSTKFSSYLQQLGIAYPTVTPTPAQNRPVP